MRLTLKLIIAITLAILVVLGVNALIRVQREVTLFEEDIRRDSRTFGRTLAGAVRRIWTTVGEAEALDLVADADEREAHLGIRLLRLDAAAPGPELAALSDAQRQSLVDGKAVFVKRGRAEGDEPALYSYVPIALPDGRFAALELRDSMVAERRYVHRTILQALIATGALVVVCGLLAAALGIFFVGRPVRRLVAHARRIGAGDLRPQGAAGTRDEIGDLAREMDAMCERLAATRSELETETATRLATQEQLRHADRLSTVGTLAAGIAHEVGTPLNVITGYAQLVQGDHAPGTPTHDHAAIIDEQAKRVAAIIRQLLDFARQRTLRKARCDLVPVVRQVASLLEAFAVKKTVSFALRLPDAPLEAAVDAAQIQQVLTNLMVNGVQAMARGGELAVTLERLERAAPDADASDARPVAVVSVQDDGAGMSDEVRAHIFEPFYTTKGVGEGTGLGLSVAYGIVKEHGGWIEVTSRPGEGSCFRVYLPMEPTDDP